MENVLDFRHKEEKELRVPLKKTSEDLYFTLTNIETIPVSDIVSWDSVKLDTVCPHCGHIFPYSIKAVRELMTTDSADFVGDELHRYCCICGGAVKIPVLEVKENE